MENKQKPKTGTARLLQLAATKKPFIILSVILSACASIAAFIPYIMIYYIIREILGIWPDALALDVSSLSRYGIYAFLGVVLNILLYFGALVFSHLAAFGTLYELKIDFSKHIAKVPLGFHALMGSGKIRKIMDKNIEDIEGFIAHQLPDIVAAFTAPVVMIVILFSVDWRYGLAAAIGIILAFVFQITAYGKEGAKIMMEKYQTAMENMNNASVEYIRGISEVKAFKQTVYSFRRLNDTIKEYTKFVIPYTLSWENIFSLYTTLINNIYLFIIPVAILFGKNTSDYRAFASTTIFYFIFVPSIAGTLMKVMYVNSNSMRILHGIEAMDAMLNEPVLSQPEKPRTIDRFDICFDNVSFSYDEDKDVKALSGISFTAEQGKITAIVGPSGGGKSTIAHLIPRFFDVCSGSIRIGGVDIKDMNSSYLMEQVSFVFQDVFLFKQSIKDNLKRGRPAATDEEIINAAKAARCHDFIMALPNGYDTAIGTKDVHLSGGEKQRLAIARAIIKDAPIIILDEATAFADPENEHLIQKAFEKLMHDKTVIIIAHRLSTIKSADKIVVISKGEKIEEGTHKELVAKEDKYAAMWKTYNETASWTMRRKEKSS